MIFLVFMSNFVDSRTCVRNIFGTSRTCRKQMRFINRKAEALSFVLSICRYFRASRFFSSDSARVLGRYSARSVARFETNQGAAAIKPSRRMMPIDTDALAVIRPLTAGVCRGNGAIFSATFLCEVNRSRFTAGICSRSRSRLDASAFEFY